MISFEVGKSCEPRFSIGHVRKRFLRDCSESPLTLDKEIDMKIISTDKAPAAIGPYSQAVVTGNLVYASGQIPVIPSKGTLAEGDITVQAEQACKNVGTILAAAGTSFEKVVKTTCFIADINDFAAFNAVYEKYFVSKPARSCVEVSALPKNALCEIEVIAELP